MEEEGARETPRIGWLAKEWGGQELPLKVLKSAVSGLQGPLPQTEKK